MPIAASCLQDLILFPVVPRSITTSSELSTELDCINARDVIASDEELVRGARSIAVLVPRPPGERPLAVEIMVPSSAYTVNRLVKVMGPRLKRTARLISGGRT